MCMLIQSLLLSVIVFKTLYCQPPNFSNLAESSELSPTLAPSICSIYDSKQSLNFDDVYQRCEIVANSKSPSGLAACQILPDIVNLLKSCSDKNTFEEEFIKIAKSKLNSFNSPDGRKIRGVGVVFEPFTFENIDFYAPNQKNVHVTGSDEFFNLADNYNYYTECVSVFGDDCMWYHKSKIETYYKQSGGAWFIEFDITINGQQYIQETFFVPVIVEKRFYGLINLDTLHQ